MVKRRFFGRLQLDHYEPVRGRSLGPVKFYEG